MTDLSICQLSLGCVLSPGHMNPCITRGELRRSEILLRTLVETWEEVAEAARCDASKPPDVRETAYQTLRLCAKQLRSVLDQT